MTYEYKLLCFDSGWLNSSTGYSIEVCLNREAMEGWRVKSIGWQDEVVILEREKIEE